jgi:hypothetical protein
LVLLCTLDAVNQRAKMSASFQRVSFFPCRSRFIQQRRESMARASSDCRYSKPGTLIPSGNMLSDRREF